MNQTSPTSRSSQAAQSLPFPPATAGPADARWRVAVVSASWHQDLVHRARDALVQELARHGIGPDRVDCFDVPGAFEIPLHAQRLARAGAHDAIVACALVVDGGIYRHDFVAHAVIDGLMRVQLDTGVPVFSAVLTPQAFHEHVDHRAFFAQHLEKKGIEAAHACLGQLKALNQLAQAA